MKTIKAILITTIALVFSFNIKAQVVPGSNLNIGENNTLTQTGNTYHSNAIGTGNYLEGNNSLAVGENDTILYPGGASIALGSCNKIAANVSFAIGSNVKVLGLRGVGIGHLVKVTGPSGSMAIGSGMLGSYSNPNLFLENSYNKCLIIGFHSTKPTLTVGPSPNDYPNGDLIFDRTGKVAIGDVPVPEIAAKLHIRSDDEEEAGIFLQTLGKTRAFVRLLDEKHELAVDDDGRMHLLSISNPFHLESRNASITDGEITLGNPNDRKLKLMTTDFPAFYANASRSGNSYVCYQQGASFAIEFNNNAMLFRTAYTENNSRIMEINGWRTPLCLKTDGSIVMKGKVGINTENTTADYTLAVDGGIITTKVFIQDVDDWPDYVFEDTYKLMPLRELKKFVADNKHLPDMPSESEIVEQGYDIQEIQQALLKKIEELTIYTLQQQEEIDALKRMIDKLKEK